MMGMDKRKLAKCLVYGGATAACTYIGFIMGSEIGFEEGARITEEVYHAVYESDLQTGCRIIGGSVGAAIVNIFGLTGVYTSEKISVPLYKNFKKRFSRNP